MTETSTELATYEVQGDLVNRRDLRNRATDSWTDVLEDVGDLANRIANTDFVPATFKHVVDGKQVGNVAAVAATILAGREIGFPPMTALSSMHSIKGKVGLYAEAMRALVFQAGHEIAIETSSSAECKIKGRRNGSDQWTTVTWTIADARQAGLLNSNKNWQTYPRQMLTARASTELCRLVFPDVIRGLASVEELETLDALPGSPATAAIEAGEGRTVKRVAKKAAKKAVAKADAPAPPLPDETPTSGEESGAGDDPADSPPPLPEDALPPAASDGKGESVKGTGSSDGSDDEATPSPSSEPSPDVEVVPESDSGPLASKDQVRLVVIEFNAKGIKDKAERLYTTKVLIGRAIESANELTAKEAHSLIDTLKSCKTAEDLEAVVAATAERAEKKGGS